MASSVAPRTPDETSPSLQDGDAERPRKRRRQTAQSNSSDIPHRRQAACQPCRLRKVKCDKRRPSCSICISTGASCEYTEAIAERLTLESATESLLQRLDYLQQSIDRLNYETGTRHPQLQRGESLQSLVHPTSPASHEAPLLEPSKDFLQIPPHRASSDTVLTWDVFERNYPANALIGVLFEPDQKDGPESLPTSSKDVFNAPTGLKPPDDEKIPQLVDNFLQNVHTKNPILDVESLVKYSRRCAEHGVGWDAWSCLVLLACALGSVAKPFDTASPSSPGVRSESVDLANTPPPSSAQFFAKELQQGESCFVLACRRIGSLKPTMIGAQCHFFAGVYLMYTLRPLLSWQYFFHASIIYQLHLKIRHGIMGRSVNPFSIAPEHLNNMNRKARRIEQSLYWSCFKSESEFRVELPLPQSEVSTWEYPSLFPSPPSPLATDIVHPARLDHASSEEAIHSVPESTATAALEIRQHAKRLCNEEESWYYYLTEIALRRIGNRIVNAFFRHEQTSWLNIKPFLRIAQEFEAQVSSWSAHLPPAMQHYETTSIIRAPYLNSQNISADNFVSRELSWAIDNRLLEMQTWLYQPFLYYLIHTKTFSTSSPAIPHRDPHANPISSILNPYPSPNSQFSQPSLSPPQHLDAEDLAILRSLITSGIDCNLKTLAVRCLRHRHHGLWFDLRSLMCAALILLAVVKSGNDSWIPGGADVLWGREYRTQRDGDGEQTKVGGLLATVLEQLEFWSGEAPDLKRHGEVLREVVRDVRASYARL